MTSTPWQHCVSTIRSRGSKRGRLQHALRGEIGGGDATRSCRPGASRCARPCHPALARASRPRSSTSPLTWFPPAHLDPAALEPALRRPPVEDTRGSEHDVEVRAHGPDVGRAVVDHLIGANTLDEGEPVGSAQTGNLCSDVPRVLHRENGPRRRGADDEHLLARRQFRVVGERLHGLPRGDGRQAAVSKQPRGDARRCTIAPRRIGKPGHDRSTP